jgi:uncharacterized protein YndB with AHSA1/START domain
MSTQAADTSVRTSTVVNTPIERAFRLYTEGMGTWWPKEHHILEGELDRMVFEPRAGGRVYDVGTDGSECCWARVLEFERPHRFVMSWDIKLDWKLETDHDRATEVEAPRSARRRAGTPASKSSRRPLRERADGGRRGPCRAARRRSGRGGPRSRR